MRQQLRAMLTALREGADTGNSGAGVIVGNLVNLIEEYAKDETGVRELKRCIEQVAQKLNMLRMYNAKELPFHIKDFALPFVVKKEHIDLFLKKKEDKHAPPIGMYM